MFDMAAVEVDFATLPADQQNAVLEILKARKLSRKRLGAMVTINLILPPVSPPSYGVGSQHQPQSAAYAQIPSAPAMPVQHDPILAEQFPELLSLLGRLRFPRAQQRSAKQPVDRLTKQIDAFLDDKKTVMALQRVQSENGVSIAEMLFRHFTDRCRLRSALETALLDFARGLQEHRSSCMQVDTFARLVSGEFDSTDLLFYKYVRSLTRTTKGQMTHNQCISLSRRMFGAEQENIHLALSHTLASEIEAVGAQVEPDVLIDTQFFVYLAVWVFHHQRREMGLLENKRPPSQGKSSRPVSSHALPAPIPAKAEAPVDDIEEYINSIRQYREATRALKPESNKPSKQQPSPIFPTRSAHDAIPSQQSVQSHLHSASKAATKVGTPLVVGRSMIEDEDDEFAVEREIQLILLDSCREYTQNETHAKLLAREADALLQIIMTGDYEAWHASVGSTASFDELIDKRDFLLTEEGAEEDSRRRIVEFCALLAQVTVKLIHQQ